jgi:putative component of membrane protein insertase Oxa1/YidC/SpoIIIJ protein YidD
MKKITLIGCYLFLLVNGIQSQDLNKNGDINKSSSSEDYISFYQKNISDLRSGSCPMYPSCSNYALETIKEKGLITGIINGSDRLLRCGHEHKYYNLTFQEKGFKLIDLPNNAKETNLLFHVDRPSHTFNSFYQDTTLNLLATLINDGLYSEALVEINKIKIGKTNFGDELIAFEMICLNAMKKYDKVIYNYSLLNNTSKNYTSILTQLFNSHLKLENYNNILQLDSVLLNKDKTEFRVRQLLNLVFTSYVNENKLNEAKRYIINNRLNNLDNQNAEMVLNDLNSIKYKSPTLATISSIIIPGSGYVYAGHAVTGISALIFNSLLAYATYTSFKSNNTGMGVLTGLIGMGFYISNVQGSAKSVIRYNNYKKQQVIKGFERKLNLNN